MFINLAIFLCFFGKVVALNCASPVTFPDQKTTGMKIATNDSGEVVALWIAEEKEGEAVYVSSQTGDASWSVPERISSLVPDIVCPRVAIDARGNTIASWVVEISDEESVLQVCEKPQDSSWSKPESIVSSTGYIQLEEGYLTTAWESVGRWSPDFSTSPKSILHAKKPFQQAVEWDYIAQTCCSSYNELAVASHAEGALFAVWERRTAEGQYVLEYAWRPPGMLWTPVSQVPIGASLRSWHIQVVIDAQENVTLVGRSSGKLIALSCLYGVWSEPVLLTQEDERASSYKLVIDEAGNAFIAWTRKNEYKEVLYTAYKPVGKDWTTSAALSSDEYDCCCYDAKSDFNGHFVVCWGQTADNAVAIHGASFTTKEQTWSDSQLLSPQGISCWSPSLAFSKNGKSFLGWVTEGSVQITEIKE